MSKPTRAAKEKGKNRIRWLLAEEEELSETDDRVVIRDETRTGFEVEIPPRLDMEPTAPPEPDEPDTPNTIVLDDNDSDDEVQEVPPPGTFLGALEVITKVHFQWSHW